ncbi:MAG: hypothetical protein IJ225_04460 [Solobacterium sp.]|nr:hypothetical protein [Solobacterium sp.]
MVFLIVMAVFVTLGLSARIILSHSERDILPEDLEKQTKALGLQTARNQNQVH